MAKRVYTFLPPGVQRRLHDELGQVPRVLPPAAAKKIEAMWKRRNTCDANEIDAIDAEIAGIAIASFDASSARQSAGSNARRNRMQNALDRRERDE